MDISLDSKDSRTLEIQIVIYYIILYIYYYIYSDSYYITTLLVCQILNAYRLGFY